VAATCELLYELLPASYGPHMPARRLHPLDRRHMVVSTCRCGSSDSIAPVVRAAPLMSYGDDNNLILGVKIDDVEGEAAEHEPSRFCDVGTAMIRERSQTIHSPLNIVDELSAQSRGVRFISRLPRLRTLRAPTAETQSQAPTW
jgi:hypothetical protein